MSAPAGISSGGGAFIRNQTAPPQAVPSEDPRAASEAAVGGCVDHGFRTTTVALIDDFSILVERREPPASERLFRLNRKVGLTEERDMIEKLRKVAAFSRFYAAGEPKTFKPVQAAPKSAREAFFQMVDEVAFEDRLPFDLAMAKVKAQRPDVVAAAFSPARRACVSRDMRELLAA